MSETTQPRIPEFISRAAEAAKIIAEKVNQNEQVQIMSHFDADGLCAAGIVGTALQRAGAIVHLRAVTGLDEQILGEFLSDDAGLLVLTDMGAGMMELLNEKVKHTVVVLDHHQPVGQPGSNVVHVNPHDFGVDGARQISGAGVSYLAARAMSAENLDLASLAIVGALGDMQDKGERRSLSSLNDTIAEDAVKSGVMRLDKDLVLYGRETRPIHKALAYTTNPFLPGLSGQEDQCLALLSSAGISVKENDRWRALADLTEKEKQSLVEAVIRYITSKGISGNIVLNLIGTVYTLAQEERSIPTRDAREFASLLNACGRMNRPGLAIALAMGERGGTLDEAQSSLAEYRRTIATYMNWATEKPERIEQMAASYIIHGEDTIDENMTGAISSIMTSSGMFDSMKAIIVAAKTKDGYLKISARATEPLLIAGVNLGVILQEISTKYGGMGGGHDVAAGAEVPFEESKPFLIDTDEAIRKVVEVASVKSKDHNNP